MTYDDLKKFLAKGDPQRIEITCFLVEMIVSNYIDEFGCMHLTEFLLN